MPEKVHHSDKFIAMRNFLTMLFVFLGLTLFSQKATISGYVSDAQTGEKLIGVNVYDAKTFKGTITNTYGFYSFSADDKEIKLTFSMVGYQTYQQNIVLDNSRQLNVELSPSIDLDEVTIVESVVESGVRSSQMGIINVPVKVIQNLPTFLGEVDIIKSIQLLPGVQSGTEGMSGMYVRGGGPDQNLILLDGVPVYNVNHLFGFYSVFNPDAVQNVKLVKGGFPARYGGRLSSVLDISMKEGNTKKIRGTGSIGLIASKLTIDGPVGENTSFLISGRRTYLDVLTAPIVGMIADDAGYDKMRTGYFFYDLNAKINHKFSDKSRLFLSTYIGKDKFYMNLAEKHKIVEFDPETEQDVYRTVKSEDNAELWWGNITTALRWNYLFSDKLFSNTTATYSRYKMLVGSDMLYDNTKFQALYTSGIEDYGAKIDFDYYPTTRHSVKFGLAETYHIFNPGVVVVKLDSETDEDYEFKASNKSFETHEITAYIEDDIDLKYGFKLNAGLHWSGYAVKDKFFNKFQPRLSLMYLVNEKLSIKSAYAVMQQYINLLANSTIGLPTDLWVPVTKRIAPNNSQQLSLGAVYEYSRDFEFSTEAFYKTMDNIIEYRDGATFFSIENNWEDKVVMGKGRSFGLELLLMKKYGKTTGWIGYTLSKSDRQFDRPGQEISYGKVFPYKFDRRHDISFVLTHKFSDNFDIGVTWVYGTGNATTLEMERYPSLDQTENFNPQTGLYGNNFNTLSLYETRNNYRMPSYHRLDVGVNFHKKKKRGVRTWNISVYNLYNRKNPFFIRWGYDGAGKRALYSYSLFPVLPTASWKFEF